MILLQKCNIVFCFFLSLSFQLPLSENRIGVGVLKNSDCLQIFYFLFYSVIFANFFIFPGCPDFFVGDFEIRS